MGHEKLTKKLWEKTAKIDPKLAKINQKMAKFLPNKVFLKLK